MAYNVPAGPSKAHGRDETVLRHRLRELGQVRVRYGCRRLHTLLRREGWADNHKRVHRFCCLEGLNLRSKRPRRNRAAAHRLKRVALTQPHQSWSMDFVANNLFDGREIRALAIVDNFSRQCLAIHVGQSLKGEDVVAVMTRLQQELRVVPIHIQVDNGSEVISKALDRWAYGQQVTLDFSRPGKPTDNPSLAAAGPVKGCFTRAGTRFYQAPRQVERQRPANAQGAFVVD